MPDEQDWIQDIVQRDTDGAIAKHAERVAQRLPASTICIDCDDIVEPQRFAMGACRCFSCQTDHETRERIGVAGDRRRPARLAGGHDGVSVAAHVHAGRAGGLDRLEAGAGAVRRAMNDNRRQLTLDRIRACIAAADRIATPEQLLVAERALADIPAPRQPSLFEAAAE